MTGTNMERGIARGQVTASRKKYIDEMGQTPMVDRVSFDVWIEKRIAEVEKDRDEWKELAFQKADEIAGLLLRLESKEDTNETKG